MLNSNNTRRDFAERLQEIIDNYNADSTSADDDFVEKLDKVFELTPDLEIKHRKWLHRTTMLKYLSQ